LTHVRSDAAANALLYGVLSDAVALGKAVGKPTATFEAARTSLFGALNGRPSNLWDEEKGQCRFPNRVWFAVSAVVLAHFRSRLGAGAFRDNPTSGIFPQDGNSIAIWFNATTPDRRAKISTYLKTNWGKFGSSSPEWKNDVGTFPGSMEVNAHASMGDSVGTQRAVDLIKLQWGYMYNHPNGTQSTFWEGYVSPSTATPRPRQLVDGFRSFLLNAERPVFVDGWMGSAQGRQLRVPGDLHVARSRLGDRTGCGVGPVRGGPGPARRHGSGGRR